jgi:hypothetical protein
MKKANNTPDYNLVNQKIAERLEYFNKLDQKERKSKKERLSTSKTVQGFTLEQLL